MSVTSIREPGEELLRCHCVRFLDHLAGYSEIPPPLLPLQANQECFISRMAEYGMAAGKFMNLLSSWDNPHALRNSAGKMIDRWPNPYSC